MGWGHFSPYVGFFPYVARLFYHVWVFSLPSEFFFGLPPPLKISGGAHEYDSGNSISQHLYSNLFY